MSVRIYPFLLALVGATLLLGSAHCADLKRQIVWDGFSFQAESSEKFSKKLHPSRDYLFSEDYDGRFAAKIKGINDDRFEFVNAVDDEKGETLHLTITISLEWADLVPLQGLSGLKDDSLVGSYRFCSTLMLYSATSSRYMIENASGMCHVRPIYARHIDNMSITPSFISEFVNFVEKDWLAEASQIIGRRQKNFKSITVSSVSLAPSVYEGDEFKRQRLRIYVAEKMSEQLSSVFRKPIIPSSVSGNGALALSFNDKSRNRSIMLWPAANNLQIEVEPEASRRVEDKKTGIPKNYFYAILKTTHESASGNRFLDAARFYSVTETTEINRSGESQVLDSIIKAGIFVENLERLIGKIAAQIKSPDKKWIDNSVHNTDPKIAFKGFSQMRDALND